MSLSGQANKVVFPETLLVPIWLFTTSSTGVHGSLLRSCHGDTVAILPGKSKTGTEDIKIRVLEVILSDGSREYLGTNIFDTAMSVDMFRELYFLRWPVEGKYME